MELAHGTRKDDLRLLNELLQMFLVVHKTVDDKQAMFFAIVFSNLMTVNPSIAISEMNSDALNYFFDEIIKEYPEIYTANFSKAKYLLNPEYLIRTTDKDTQTFLDIINSCQPVYLQADNTLATMYDSSISLSVVNGIKEFKRDYKDIITYALSLFYVRANNIKSEMLKNNFMHNLNMISENMHRLALTKPTPG